MQTDIIILEKEKKKKQKKASTKVGGNLQKVLNVKWSLCWAVTYLKLVSFNQQARDILLVNSCISQHWTLFSVCKSALLNYCQTVAQAELKQGKYISWVQNNWGFFFIMWYELFSH